MKYDPSIHIWHAVNQTLDGLYLGAEPYKNDRSYYIYYRLLKEFCNEPTEWENYKSIRRNEVIDSKNLDEIIRTINVEKQAYLTKDFHELKIQRGGQGAFEYPKDLTDFLESEGKKLIGWSTIYSKRSKGQKSGNKVGNDNCPHKIPFLSLCYFLYFVHRDPDFIKDWEYWREKCLKNENKKIPADEQKRREFLSLFKGHYNVFFLEESRLGFNQPRVGISNLIFTEDSGILIFESAEKGRITAEKFEPIHYSDQVTYVGDSNPRWPFVGSFFQKATVGRWVIFPTLGLHESKNHPIAMMAIAEKVDRKDLILPHRGFRSLNPNSILLWGSQLERFYPLLLQLTTETYGYLENKVKGIPYDFHVDPDVRNKAEQSITQADLRTFDQSFGDFVKQEAFRKSLVRRNQLKDIFFHLRHLGRPLEHITTAAFKPKKYVASLMKGDQTQGTMIVDISLFPLLNEAYAEGIVMLKEKTFHVESERGFCDLKIASIPFHCFKRSKKTEKNKLVGAAQLMMNVPVGNSKEDTLFLQLTDSRLKTDLLSIQFEPQTTQTPSEILEETMNRIRAKENPSENSNTPPAT